MLISQALPNSNFANKTISSFSYAISVGLEKVLSDKWRLGAGYEFTDWGKSELGRSAGQTLNSGLSLKHMYTHNAMAHLTYIV